MKFDTIMDSLKENAALATDIVRVRCDLRRATSRLAILFRRLGSTVYEQHLAKEDKSEEINAILGAIDEKRAEMDILYAELYALNGEVECAGCHSIVSSDCDFCPKCGQRIFYNYAEDGTEEATEEDGKKADAE